MNHSLQGTIQSRCPGLCSRLNEQLWRSLPGQRPLRSFLTSQSLSKQKLRVLWGQYWPEEFPPHLAQSKGLKIDSELPSHSSFGGIGERHLRGPRGTAAQRRGQRKWRTIWSIQATMNSLTLTCLSLIEIKAKARELPHTPIFSPEWSESFSEHSASLSSAHSWREFLSQSLLPVKSVNWCNYLDCSRKKKP